ncbi:unannotated protein [freshwater metagenome]|uniref:Unannotated protein n=1 Tax=freshwater metagenome TaxID=449393 RepID=A0A6J7KQJ0_9ZZZZ
MMTMSHSGFSGKYMLQNESLEPLGRGSYFISVMYEWLVTNGITQNADRSTAKPMTLKPKTTAALSLIPFIFGSIQNSNISATPPNTNNKTMP